MTAKEKLLERVRELSEAEAEETLQLLDRRASADRDEWGDLDSMLDGAATDLMAELDAEERAAGHEPWRK